jgi:hypothetical protein
MPLVMKRYVRWLLALVVFASAIVATWIIATQRAERLTLDRCRELLGPSEGPQVRTQGSGDLYILSTPNGDVRQLCTIAGNRIRCE